MSRIFVPSRTGYSDSGAISPRRRIVGWQPAARCRSEPPSSTTRRRMSSTWSGAAGMAPWSRSTGSGARVTRSGDWLGSYTSTSSLPSSGRPGARLIRRLAVDAVHYPWAPLGTSTAVGAVETGNGRLEGFWARLSARLTIGLTEGEPLFPLIVLFGLNCVDELDK